MERFRPCPSKAVGYGAGQRDLPGMPNVLRVVVGRGSESMTTERIVVLECEIDDMNPQIFGSVMSLLYEAGALEVFYAPVQMKKSRPGTWITVLSPPELREALSEVLFRETTTIG
jgi:pyridinium-3,5-bisthiocarboxylic acid mononucleotide nickel chelatase